MGCSVLMERKREPGMIKSTRSHDYFKSQLISLSAPNSC